jgi:glutathione reductase (NADPH)
MKKYDWIVIGGGSGGLSVIETAIQFGKKCLLIDPNPLGGTCVNVGCVPKKMMWFLTDVYEKSTLLKDYEIKENIENKRDFLFSEFVEKRQKSIKNINTWYEAQISNKATYIKGTANFISANKIRVGKDVFEGERIVVSTGSTPVYPEDIEGAEHGITSDGFFELREIPKSVCIVGSGYIALELASLIATLQKIKYNKPQVTVLVRSNQILKNIDKETACFLQKQITLKGINFLFQSQIKKITRKNKELHIKLKSIEASSSVKNMPSFNPSDFLKAETLIWATGRKPKITSLDLNKTKIKTDSRGYIQIDEFFETQEPNHFALGDVIDKPQLTPVAVQSGRRLVRQIYEDKQEHKVSFDFIPTAIFTHPPLSTIGMSSEKAKEEGIETEEFFSKFTPMLYNFSSSAPETFIKLVCEKQSQKVLGLHMVGEGVDEILQGFAVAIKMGATKKDFDRTMAIHPTSAEEIVTLKPIS